MANGITHKVFQVKDRGEGKKAFWNEIGVGFENRDGSLSIMLDSIPLTGKLQVRTFEPNKKSN